MPKVETRAAQEARMAELNQKLDALVKRARKEAGLPETPAAQAPAASSAQK